MGALQRYETQKRQPDDWGLFIYHSKLKKGVVCGASKKAIHLEGEKRKCLTNKMSGAKMISSNTSLPGRGTLSDVNFLYECRFPLWKVTFDLFFRASVSVLSLK